LLPRDVPMRAGYRRIVLDRQLRLPLDCNLVKSIDRGPVVDCTNQPLDSDHANALSNAGVTVAAIDGYFKDPKLNHVLSDAGPTLAMGTFRGTHRLWVIRSPKIIGDNTAPSAAKIPGHFVKTGEIDLASDVLCEYLNTISPVFFAAVPSADFVLAQSEPGRVGPDRGGTPRL